MTRFSTASGAWACLIVIVVIVLLPIFTTEPVVKGWEIVVIVIAIVGAIVFYGTFIFKRALTATGQIGRTALTVAAPHAADQDTEARGKRSSVSDSPD